MMAHDLYTATKARIHAEVADEIRSFASDIHVPAYNTYLVCRANKYHFLPGNDKTDIDFYRDVKFYQNLAIEEESIPGVFDNVTISGDTSFMEQIRQQPYIFCTFHLGAYRMINFFMARNAYNFALVVDNSTVTRQAEKFNQLFATNGSSEMQFKILNAESSSVGLQMIREIKSRNSLMFYIDGNSGVGGMGRNDDKLTCIDFLGKKIYARKGIAFISHVTGVPIIPVISWRDADGSSQLRFFSPISPEAGSDREAYSQATTQQLYNLFAGYLLQYPEQWEGWLYINKFLDLSCLNNPQADAAALTVQQAGQSAICFNNERFAIFGKDQQHYLFDRDTFACFHISDNMSRLLLQLKTPQQIAGSELLSKPAIRNLIEQSVIRLQ